MEAKKQEILDAGGAAYRTLKVKLDEAQRAEAECTREVTRNKSTLAGSDTALLRVDSETSKLRATIEELTAVREKLQAEINKNDAAGHKLLADCQACEAVKLQCSEVLDGKKKDFSEMKRTLEVINVEEAKLKDKLEDMARERELHKKKCDQIKQSLKINRDKFRRSLDEFGDEDSENAQNEQRSESRASA